ncbi:MAG: hypothetical protein KDC74_07170 [Flavobacteriaceae bacterium]|nr:hypothetical protein [Flavobacteriaceae bacterium]
MDLGYEKESFKTFKLKSSVAKKFRRFCRQHAKSQSMTLLEMLEFFEVNEVSPDTRLGKTIASLEDQYKKRSNAIIAIIKNIEKNQTKPTTAMLQKLFEEATNEEDEGDYDFGTPTLISENEELEYYRNEYENIKEQQLLLHDIIDNLINKITHVKKNFGSDFYRLELSKEAFQNLKKQMKNVYHDHRTEDRR